MKLYVERSSYPMMIHVPRLDRFPTRHHCFNTVNLLDRTFSISFVNILSEYLWNAEICIGSLIGYFRCGWQFFWWWQIDARWNSCEETRTIRILINRSAASLFQNNFLFYRTLGNKYTSAPNE